MPKGMLFWVIFVIAVLFWGGSRWTNAPQPFLWASDFIVFVLIGIIAWQVFGPIVH